jgi:carbonic anhydrase/acetyltransferase-like protein (isoleucine patch superfamily)
MMQNVISIDGNTPRIASDAFVAPNAVVIGDVVIGPGSSVWFGCVLRGDIGPIRIGARTNIQDLTCGHMTQGLSELTVGDDVTVGHGVLLHGCTIEDGVLVGMGSIVLDGAIVGKGSVVAAGSLVPPRMVIPPGSFVRGSPAKIVRDATDDERAMGIAGAGHYVHNAARFRALFDARSEAAAHGASEPDGEAVP